MSVHLNRTAHRKTAARSGGRRTGSAHHEAAARGAAADGTDVSRGLAGGRNSHERRAFRWVAGHEARAAIIPGDPPRVNRALSAARVERGYQLPERVLAQAVLEAARLLVGDDGLHARSAQQSAEERMAFADAPRR